MSGPRFMGNYRPAWKTCAWCGGRIVTKRRPGFVIGQCENYDRHALIGSRLREPKATP